MDHGPWTTDHGPWTMDHGPWTTDHGPRTMDRGPWPMDHGPYANGYKHRGVLKQKDDTFMRSPAMMTITIRTVSKFCTRGRAEQPEIFFLDPIHSGFCGCRPQGIMEEEPGRRYLGGIWEPSGSPGRAQGGQESSRRPRVVLDTKRDTPLSYNAKVILKC